MHNNNLEIKLFNFFTISKIQWIGEGKRLNYYGKKTQIQNYELKIYVVLF